MIFDMDKEILYLNNNLVNSLLAQHNGGLVSIVSSEDSSSKKMTKGNEVGGEISTRVGVDASAGLGKILSHFDASVNGELTAKEDGHINRSNELSEGQKDIINKTFHDYSLTILLEDQAKSLKTDVDSAQIGEIVKVKTLSALFDFELLSEFLTASNNNGLSESGDAEDAIKRFKLINKIDYKKAESIFEYYRLDVPLPTSLQTYYNAHQALINEYQKLYDELTVERRAIRNIHILHKYLDNICLLKIDGALCLMEKNYLYESSRIIDFRINDQKKINVFGRVVNVTNENYGQIEENFSSMPLRMMERLLKMIKLIEPGTKIIETTALYY